MIVVSVRKAKGGNKNVAAIVSRGEYKNVLLNNKCLRHSMNRIQSKNHKTGTYEIDKNFALTIKYISQTMDMMD